MKLRFLIATLILAAGAGSLAVAQAPLPASSKIIRVTVYPDRAMVTRRAELDLPKGESTLVLSGLPPSLLADSVQASGSGAFTLRDVRVAVKQQIRDASAERTRLEEERRRVEERLAIVEDRTREAEAERLFLAEMVKRLTATSAAADAEGLPADPAVWAKLLDFQRSRNAALNASLRDSRAEARTIKAELDRIDRELRALGGPVGPATYEVSLVVSAAASTKARLDLSYIVIGPSWRPDYVLRADSNGAKIAVQYRGFVRQSTGEAWDGVELSLSTARPTLGGGLPSLSPWFVDIYEPPVYRERAEARGYAAPAPSAASAESFAKTDMDAVADEAYGPAMEVASSQALSGATSVTFAIPGATSVASDNVERTVSVALLELEASYTWAAVPKLSPFAYFRAEARNASDYPFLPGSTHVYVDSAYVTDASMGAVPSGGTFQVDLGVDEAVKVERKLVRKFDETGGVLAKRAKTTWEYEILVSNGKKREIALSVSDQAPVPADERIVVKLLAPAYSKDTESLKKLSGDIYEWTLKLAPGAEQKLPLAFSMDYPKGETILGVE